MIPCGACKTSVVHAYPIKMVAMTKEESAALQTSNNRTPTAFVCAECLKKLSNITGVATIGGVRYVLGEECRHLGHEKTRKHIQAVDQVVYNAFMNAKAQGNAF